MSTTVATHVAALAMGWLGVLLCASAIGQEEPNLAPAHFSIAINSNSGYSSITDITNRM